MPLTPAATAKAPARRNAQPPGRESAEGTATGQVKHEPTPAECAQLAHWVGGGGTTPGHGEALRMLGSVGNNWVAAKGAYVGRDGAPMLTLTGFRRPYVDELLKALLRNHPGAFLAAPGSDNETSDYDVAVLGGEGTWAVLREFNNIMREVWGTESGITFDTNVYVDLAVPPTSRLPSSADSWQMKGGRPNTDPEWVRVQETASLAKMRRFMSAGDWQRFTRGIRDEVMAASGAEDGGRPVAARFEQTRRTDSLFGAADGLYRAYVRDLARLLRARGHGADRPAMDDERLVTHLEHHDENAVMEARNVLYAVHMRGAQNLARSFVRRGPSAAGDPAPRSKPNVADLNARAQIYAMEAYHSAGAVFDVVHRQQAGKVTAEELSEPDYGQSFNEQVGDALKDLTHYGSDPGKAFYQSSKYVYRMTLAADKILEYGGGSLPPQAEELLAALRHLSSKTGVLQRIRNGADKEFASLTEDQRSARARTETLGLLGTDSLDEFRRRLLDLARAVLVMRYSRP
ncbi:hypothetical protein [Streptomyces sp. NPDC048340]|uniref:hypothetical protein n=1 Tax=Streptomyces sp. NPDC048340 TaxID=3365537 RepID=UPI00371D329A